MQKHSTKAEPLSKETIRKKVKDFKERYGISLTDKIDVIRWLERLDNLGFLEIEVVTDNELKNSYAETNLLTRKIYIRETVYNNAAAGDTRDRFTIAHELGHIVLHTETIIVCRIDEKIKTYEDPEWQANQFAAEFLAPLEEIDIKSDINEISQKFQISKEAATYRKKDATSHKNSSIKLFI